EKAVRYLRRAGVRAAARSALPQARARLEHALRILDAMPDGRPELEEAFEIILALRPVFGLLNEPRLMLEHLRRAESVAERLQDDRRRGLIYAFIANAQSRLNEPDQALVTGERALEIADRLGDLRLRLLTTSYLVQAHHYRGEHRRAVEL